MSNDQVPYQVRLSQTLNSAPEPFRKAYHLMQIGQYEEAFKLFDYCVENNIHIADSLSVGAWCQYRMGNDFVALFGARGAAKSQDITLIGRHHFWYVMVHANNQSNNFDQALQFTQQAIDYFNIANEPESVSEFLEAKANILKQLAAPLSHDVKTIEQAKKLIIDAIHAIIESISIAPPDSSHFEYMKEEIDAIARIAGRSCVSFDDLNLNKNPSDIHPLLDPFNRTSMACKRTNELWNETCLARSKGDYEKALQYFERAVIVALEDSANSRGFKVLILYQYGVTLLKHHGLENLADASKKSGCSSIAVKVRQLWRDALRLYNTLSKDEIAELNLGPIDEFAARISNDFMITGYKDDDVKLVKDALKQQAPAGTTSEKKSLNATKWLFGLFGLIIVILVIYFGLDNKDGTSVDSAIEKSGSIGIVTVNIANIRSGPSVSDPVIGKAQKGDTLSVISQSKGWLQIEYGNKKGHISTKLVKQ